jgi:hypothetical protein
LIPLIRVQRVAAGSRINCLRQRYPHHKAWIQSCTLAAAALADRPGTSCRPLRLPFVRTRITCFFEAVILDDRDNCDGPEFPHDQVNMATLLLLTGFSRRTLSRSSLSGRTIGTMANVDGDAKHPDSSMAEPLMAGLSYHERRLPAHKKRANLRDGSFQSSGREFWPQYRSTGRSRIDFLP